MAFSLRCLVSLVSHCSVLPFYNFPRVWNQAAMVLKNGVKIEDRQRRGRHSTQNYTHCYTDHQIAWELGSWLHFLLTHPFRRYGATGSCGNDVAHSLHGVVGCIGEKMYPQNLALCLDHLVHDQQP